ncbi:hypothetical protein [Heyndrickxia shackletonii]|uniref:hypothetical protein n=1 Tax=Heyndrickxia shackletonii TaxID=157838 RepID=UPI000AAE7582|nr:hypothetical protein [Heyndrickxia shackletonii]NEZ02060.1 hypothetical protein [Heyndrickxia shackletonii]
MIKKLIIGAMLVIALVGFSITNVNEKKTAGGGIGSVPIGGSPAFNAIPNDTYLD